MIWLVVMNNAKYAVHYAIPSDNGVPEQLFDLAGSKAKMGSEGTGKPVPATSRVRLESPCVFLFSWKALHHRVAVRLVAPSDRLPPSAAQVSDIPR